jgi:glycosyltransferase involved in cell wall biosynthesis
MKVLHVTPSYYPAIQFGGPVRSVHALNNALIQSGITVDVATTNAGLLKRSDIPIKKTIYVDQVPVIYFPFWGYQHYNFSISLLLYVFKQVRHYDVIHITAVWNFPVLATAFACLWHRKPYILSPRGTIYPETIAHRSGRLKKLYYNLIAGISVKRANLLHFTTEDEASRVMEYLHLKNKYVTIYNGVTIPEIAPISNITDRPFILFIGRIDKKKGLDILIEAYSIFCQTYTEYDLVIAGPDNEGYLSTLQEQCKEKKITDRVQFTGELEGDSKWNMYKHASLFVLSSYSENFGMTVAEAMLLKCPILISNQVGLSDIVKQKDAGWVCKATAEDLVEKMQEAMNSKEMRIEKAERAYHFAKEHFNIQSVATQFIEAYSSLLPKS